MADDLGARYDRGDDRAVRSPVWAARCTPACRSCRDRCGRPGVMRTAVLADPVAHVTAPTPDPAPEQAADSSRTVIRAFVYVLDPTPEQASVMRSHCGAQRFAYNWALSQVKANLDQRAAERSYEIPDAELTPPVSWSAYSLRKHWNTVKNDVAVNTDTGQVWWPENSKEAYSSGIANCAAALTNWSDARSGKRKGAMGFPRFKGKRASLSCRFTTGSVGLVTDGGDRRHIQLPRIGWSGLPNRPASWHAKRWRGRRGFGRRPCRFDGADGRCRSPSKSRSPPGHSHPPPLVPTPRSVIVVWAVRWSGSMWG
ncbi:helix-turn-helix domain-containing protein [Rhodococcus opacus]|nr:helix-turn-helix domain-containing protein [Rhodococcus opacus]